MDETISYYDAESLSDFFDLLLKKKRVLELTGSWNKFHFSTRLPFVRGGITGMVEEDDGMIRMLVTCHLRTIFEEEEHTPNDWEHKRWFFATWRSLLHAEQLDRALAYFFNEMGGRFDDVQLHFLEAQQALERFHSDVAREFIKIKLLDGDPTGIRQDAPVFAQRMLWCRVIQTVREYLTYEQSQ